MMGKSKSQIEEQDRQLYDEISDVYSKKDHIPYSRGARKVRLNRSIRFADLPVNVLLELGCGAGYSSIYLDGKYNQYIGVDYSKKLIDIGKVENKGEDRIFLAKNIKDLDLKDNEKGDVVLMIGVLHHMTERVEALEMIKNFMKKDALLIMNEPLDSNFIIRFLRSIRVKIDKTYSEDQIFFSLDGYKENLEKAGYTYEMYPQGLFTTPLAETTFIPAFLGKAIFLIAKPLEQFMENVIPKRILLHFSWNVVIVAKPK